MNDFQKWLIIQGYYRDSFNGAWCKNKITISGKELSDLLNKWKEQKTKSHDTSK